MDTLDDQLARLRKDTVADAFRYRAAAAGGPLEAAFTAFEAFATRPDFHLEGRMSMSILHRALSERISAAVEALPTNGRIIGILRTEIPFGITFLLNLVEVLPGVWAREGLQGGPHGLLEDPVFTRSANVLGLCPGHVAPVIRRALTRLRDEEGIEWTRKGGKGDERNDRFVHANFEIVEGNGFRMRDEVFARIADELSLREGKVEYGGCPAIRHLMEDEFGNLLKALSQSVVKACIEHYDFAVEDMGLIRTDSIPHRKYPDPVIRDEDLY